MKKKIKVEQLRQGMYIDNFNCSWLDHPFFSNSMEVTNLNIIEKIIDNGIREVYIDTECGVDVDDAPTEEEVKEEIHSELISVLKSKRGIRKTVSLKEEIVRAKEIKEEAKQTVQKVMEDIRLGKQIELEKVESTVDKMVESIFRNKDALTSLCRIRTADEYTFYHSVSVCVLMVSFVGHLGLDPQTIRDVGVGGLLHDVGKINIPIEILTKEGNLSEDEFMKLKEHVVQGIVVLRDCSNIKDSSLSIVAEHHERLDGTGYPNALKGEEISQFGQMACIVDIYDAITTDRCYRKGMQPTEALKKLFEWSKFHFNSELVQQFIRCIGIYPVGTLVLLESGMLGVVLNHHNNNLLQPTVRVVLDTNNMKYVSPYDIDLSREGREGKIKSYESPDKWHVRPEVYL